MLTMMGDAKRNPTPTVAPPPPPWSLFNDSTENNLTVAPPPWSVENNGGDYSQLLLAEALTALQQYLPSNLNTSNTDEHECNSNLPMDSFSCDEFRMYEFKIRRCARGRSHDWTECPYAHPGEKARRRDPRKFHYSGTACPDFRKGSCKRGDTCEYAHGVFECWLHPARYRTQPCKDGTSCRRRVCFFAHTPDQLRVLSQQSPRVVPESPPSYDGSPLRQALDWASPTSTLFTPPISPPSESPPMSPQYLSRSVGANSVNDMVLASLRHLQLNKLVSNGGGGGGGAGLSPRGVQIGSGFLSPRAVSSLRPAFNSLPNTPIGSGSGSGFSKMNFWDAPDEEEEPVMDRVESGRELRSKIYEKLSKENPLDRSNSVSPGPDVGWVSELIK